MKFYFACVTLIPIRLILSLIPAFFIALHCAIAIVGHDETKPLPRWREWTKKPLHFWGRALMFVWGFYYIPTKGSPAGKEKAPIIISNHICFIEPLYLYARSLPCGVSRVEQKSVPVLGAVFRALQMIFVDRRNPNSRHITADEIKNRAHSNIPKGFRVYDGPDHPRTPTSGDYFPKSPVAHRDHDDKTEIDSMINKETDVTVAVPKEDEPSGCTGFFTRRKWPQVILFPEGTCTNNKAIIQFKVGAFAPGVPIQPCVVRYPYRNFDPCWVYAGPGGDQLFWRTISQFVNYMEVQFLPVYTPSSEEQKNPKLFAKNVRAKMAEALGVGVTEHNFDDVCLAGEAIKLKLPPAAMNVELFHLSKRMELKQENVYRYLKMFAVFLGKDIKKGAMERKHFDGLIENNPTLTDALFKEFNSTGTGSVSFREFLIAAAVMNRNCGHDSDEMAARLAYNVVSSSGTVTSKKEIVNRLVTVVNMETFRDPLTRDIKSDVVSCRDFVSAMKSNVNILDDFAKACHMKLEPISETETKKARNNDD